MGGANAARIGLTSIENPKSTILEILGTHVLGYVDGMLVYATSTGLVMAVQVDLKSRRVTGTPIPLLEQVAVEASGGAAYADVAANGDIIYQVGAYRRRLYIDGPGSAPSVVIADAATYVWPRLSPDAKRIAISITAPARTDVWVYELPGGPLTRVTREGTINDRPEWLPDSKTIVFRSNRGPTNALWKQAADGSGVAEQFFALPSSRIDEGMVSSNGQYLAYQRDTTGIGDVWFKRLDDKSAPVPIEVSTGADLSPRISPDGKWVAYQSNVSSVYQIYVRPFPSMTGRVQVSLGGGVTPVWSRDGQRLVYAAGRRLIAARLKTSPDFTVIDRDTILERDYTFTAIHADFDVMPDGRILVLRPTEEDAQLIVVRNWAAELRAKVAAGK
jgi:Tol biopolymer transport system component